MKVIQAVQELIQSGTCSLSQRIPKRKTGIFGRAPIVSPTAQAAVLEDKIRSGTINENDLNTLYFAT